MRPKLVIGAGNLLCRDDGFGVLACQRLAALPLPEDVEICEAGTGGLAAAALLERRALVVVVDAIDAGAEPGAVFRLRPEHLQRGAPGALALHELHLLDALAEAELLGRAPREVVVLAAQVADVSLGVGLTPALRPALNRVVGLVLAELGADSRTGGTSRCN